MPRLRLKNIAQDGALDGDVPVYRDVSSSWTPEVESGGSGGNAGMFYPNFTQTEVQQIASASVVTTASLGSFQITQSVSQSAMFHVIGWLAATTDFPSFAHSFELAGLGQRWESGVVDVEGNVNTLVQRGGVAASDYIYSASLSSSADTPVAGTTTVYFNVVVSASVSKYFMRSVLNWALVTSSFQIPF